MKVSSIVCLVCVLLAACGEKSIDTSRERTPTGPPIETEPKLNFAGNTVYYVHTDTLYPENNGIYRANAANPLRYKVVDGLTVTSPSASPDESKIAFLDNGLLRIYNAASKSVTNLGIDSAFSTVFFVYGDQLIGEIHNRIYIVNLVDSTVSLYREGIRPSPDRAGFFLWLDLKAGSEKDIVLTSVPLDSNETAFEYNEPIAIQYLSRCANTDRYAFVTGNGPTYTVCTRLGGSAGVSTIQTTAHPWVLMVGYDVLIFTGDNGRFYQSNFDGTSIIEYRGAETGG